MQLTAKHIRLGVQAANKREAIESVGRVLVEAGNIAPQYVQSMFGREEQANTFLGRGIAIPHGMPKDRDFIHETGIAVVQIPDGVEWNSGEIVNLVVGIAARSDEHLAILAGLMDVLDDSDTAECLAKTTDANDIIAALSRTQQDDSGENSGASSTRSSLGNGAQSDSETKIAEMTILGVAGLHARPATAFVEIASRFASEIAVEYKGRVANGKAMASLLRLGVEGGATMIVRASGADSSAAIEALSAGVAEGLGDLNDDDSAELSAAPAIQMPKWTPVSAGEFVSGVPASPGFAVAPLFRLREKRVEVRDTFSEYSNEIEILQNAIAAAHAQLEELSQEVAARGAQDEAAIFGAHIAFLDDPDLQSEAKLLMKAGHGAAWSWNTVIEARATEMRASSNALLAERAADLRDVGERVLRVLSGAPDDENVLPSHPVILIAEDLTPSQTARLDRNRVLGICTELGGPTSHTAILARALDIPAVVGLDALTQISDDHANGSGAPCVLDGEAGALYLQPNADDLASAALFAEELRLRRDEDFTARYRPALLRDGYRMEIVANIGKAQDAAQAVENGAEGVGLLRTEFLFLERESAPSEDEQFAALCEMTRALDGLPLIVRTLDIGGDKILPYLPLPHEDNPFLGVRGARLTLRRPELFETQLRAIFRASETGPIKIMFPMIGTLEEWRAVREVAERVRLEVGALPIEMGIMIEVPSAALMAREFAEEVDFFSVGTNDLTQYALAIDRLHPILGRDADGLHPAVLRLIDMTVQAAKDAGKWVGVCGGVAGDARGALILTGLGVAELSMSAPAIPEIKAALRGVTFAQTQRLAQQALKCRNAAEVRALPIGKSLSK